MLAWSIRAINILLLHAATNQSASVEALAAPSSPSTKVLRVCQSPGCKDDGAASTLERLEAVAPPGVTVVKGGCVSLCGAGPVVEVCDDDGDMTVSSIKKRRVKGREAILSLVDECAAARGGEGEAGAVEPALTPDARERLMDGYELSLQAAAALAKREHRSAADLYADAIEIGRRPAALLREARARRNDAATATDERGVPAEARWLVAACKGSCRARLALRDGEGARRDARDAVALAGERDGDAHECLAEACAATGDVTGELQAVTAAMAQYERLEEECARPRPGADAPARAEAAREGRFAAGRKRELGFRAAKLESDL